jgi:PTH1 family peptidyl-tRNA hydrolase
LTAIKLIVGLGNPGSEYRGTRHNAGADFVEQLARSGATALRAESRFAGLAGQISLAGHDLRLLIPTTFMNRSGRAVAAIATFYKITPEQILIAHDELDIQPGTARFKRGGGHGGHNGLRDLIPALGGRDFMRLRIGIGHPGHRDNVVGYVLKAATRDDRAAIDAAIAAAVRFLPDIICGNLDAAMKELHTAS